MGRICEHEFLKEDPDNPGFSQLEYDLYAKLGLSIRKNIKMGLYEIVTIKEPRMVYYASSDLYEVAKYANHLEGAENTKVECGTLCPRCPRRK